MDNYFATEGSLHMKEILNSITDGIHIVDKNGMVIYVNSAFLKLSGGEKIPYLGESIFDLVKTGMSSSSVSPSILDTGKPENKLVEYYMSGKNCILNGNPVYINGKLERVVTVVRDFSNISSIFQQVFLEKQRETMLQTAEGAVGQKGLTIGLGGSMGPIYEKVSKFAVYDVPILMTGETGTGKDYLATIIHHLSGRRGPFIRINCGAIPESLLESELFGYDTGAFTGAAKGGKPGLFERAQDGTLYLDEIGELPLPMQVKLLSAIENREITRLGATACRRINARIIAATNRPLEQLVQERQFREDLYYRLNVVRVHIPPLRERPDDILSLAVSFLGKFNEGYVRRCRLSESALEALLSYRWPGNVRELRNVMERLVIFSDGLIQKEQIRANLVLHSEMQTRDSLYQDFIVNSSERNETLKSLVEDFESHIINETIRKSGSCAKAAAVLGLDVSTLRRKRRRHR